MADEEHHETDDTAATDARLADVLDQYMAQRRSGQQPDRETLLRQHPDLADALRSCLDGIDLLSPTEGFEGTTAAGISPPPLIEDFELGEELGRGGMGVVYRARQKSLDRVVALKLLTAPLGADSKAMERFQREAETAAGLHHTNIVPIFAVGSDVATPYYAMQYIEGASLDTVLADSAAPLSQETVADWGLQAAEALTHAHQRDVIHRDIKPSNLILDNDQRIWLTDFGLARRLDDARLSMTGAVLGTPRYMSPEQAIPSENKVDHRSDIYSLGATLFELVCGKPVVSGKSTAEVIQNILKCNRSDARELRPDITRDFEVVLGRCLAADASDRYPDAASLASDLRAIKENREIQSRPLSTLEKSRRWLRTHQGTVKSVVAASVAAVTLAFLGLWFLVTYPSLNDAQVRFVTIGPSFQIRLNRIDGDGGPILASVPTPSPISVDEGQWEGLLEQSGTLSSRVRHHFAPGNDGPILLPPPPPPLWSVDDVVTSRPVDVRGKTDVVIATTATLELRDGRTGQSLWSRDRDELRFARVDRRRGFDPEWAIVAEAQKVHVQPEPICAAGDIDGDGTGDILFASYEAAALLALSGSDGSTIWQKDFGTELKTPNSGSHGTLTSVGVWPMPQAGKATSGKTASGQGTSVLAAFVSRRISFELAWLARIDASSGTIEWVQRHDFGDVSSSDHPIHAMRLESADMGYGFHGNSSSFDEVYVEDSHSSVNFPHGEPVVPLMDTSGASILWTFAADVLSVDPDTGEATKETGIFEGTPQAKTTTVRLPGGGRAILTSEQVKGGTNNGSFGLCESVLWNEDFTKKLWIKRGVADNTGFLGRWADRPALPMVVDLDHDGVDEVIIQTLRHSGDRYARQSPGQLLKHVNDDVERPSNFVWSDFQIYDTNGKPKFGDPFRIGTADLHVFHLQIVNDRDGDGIDDIAVASRYMTDRDTSGYLHVELFSAAKGTVLWHRKWTRDTGHRFPQPPYIFTFSRQVLTAPDGRGGSKSRETLLVCDVVGNGFGNHHTFHTTILDAQDGTTITTGLDISIEDRWNDSLAQGDLETAGDWADPETTIFWCRDRHTTTRNQIIGRQGRRMMAIAMPGEVHHVSQSPEITVDLDGDDVFDILTHAVSAGQSHRVRLARGDNQSLFQTPLEDGQIVLPLHADITGNGRDDALLSTRRGGTILRETSENHLAAGRTMWSSSEPSFYRDPLFVSAAKLSDGGGQDIIIIGEKERARSGAQYPLLISGISGSSGALLWSRTIQISERNSNSDLLATVDDINDDGISDLLMSYPEEDKSGSAIYAINGTSGKDIWRIPANFHSRTRWVNELPQPRVLRIGNRRFIAVVGAGSNATSSNRYFEVRVFDELGQPAGNFRLASYDYTDDNPVEKRWGRPEIVALKTEHEHRGRFAIWVPGVNSRVDVSVLQISGNGTITEHSRIALDPTKKEGSPFDRWFRIQPFDIDDDGNDELIMMEHHRLVAHSQNGNRLWETKLSRSAQEISLRELKRGVRLEVHAIEHVRTIGEVRECIVRSIEGNVCGVDLSNGKIRWTVAAPSGMELVKSCQMKGLLDPIAPLPRFAFLNHEQSYWMVRRAVASAGGIVAPAAEDASQNRESLVVKNDHSDDIDTRYLDSGPYRGRINEYMPFLDRTVPGSAIWALVICVFGILLPVGVLGKMIWQRKFSIQMMLLATAVAAGVMAVLTIPISYRPISPIDRLVAGASMLPLFMWLGFLGLLAYHKMKGTFWFWLACPLLMVIGMEVGKWVTGSSARIVTPSDALRIWRGVPLGIFATSMIMSISLASVIRHIHAKRAMADRQATAPMLPEQWTDG